MVKIVQKKAFIMMSEAYDTNKWFSTHMLYHTASSDWALIFYICNLE